MCDGTYGNDFSGIETYLTEEEVTELRKKAEFQPCTKSRRIHLAESVCEAVERGNWQEIMAAYRAWKEAR